MRRAVAALGACAVALGALTGAAHTHAGSPYRMAPDPALAAADGILKIKHVIVIMQENRSFDSYFGTYPGADGLPRDREGRFTVCLPDPRTGGCAAPFHDRFDSNGGAKHQLRDALRDYDRGRMDGFVSVSEQEVNRGCSNSPRCSVLAPSDVMGYHDGADIPNYWSYARHFVLQDHLFEPVSSYSLPSHLYLVSGWSAACSSPTNPWTCVNDASLAPGEGDTALGPSPLARVGIAWTDITYLLDRHRVSWKYYVADGTSPSCMHGTPACLGQSSGTPFIWNTLPFSADVRQDRSTGKIQHVSHFFSDARMGRLPQVSWIAPSPEVSEHPAALVSAGQTYVTSLVNAVMRSKDWDSSAIFLAWDDWGGFYDHVPPPQVDANGYGFRVPGLLISPYAQKGIIDHQTLSFDAYLKFIEDDFLGGRRLDPRTDGRPDPRPDVRENLGMLGNLVKEFDFKQRPLAPLILSLHPKTDLVGG